MASSRYENVGFVGSVSAASSYHQQQERSSPRFVSATNSRHYPSSRDRLHRLSSPSSAALSWAGPSRRFGPLSSASPRASPAPSVSSSTALLYGPKRSVSYTAGLTVGEGDHRHRNYPLAAKRTSMGGGAATNGSTNSSHFFLPNHSSSVYDPPSSSFLLRNPSSSSPNHRIIHYNYSPHSSSNRLISDSQLARFDHGLSRTLPMKPSPLVARNSRSVGNSPPFVSPPSNAAGSTFLITEDKRKKGEEEERNSRDCKGMAGEGEGIAAADESPREKTIGVGLFRRSTSPSRGSTPKSASNKPSRPTTPSKSPTPAAKSALPSSEPHKTDFAERSISPPQVSQPLPAAGLFTQLEKMIKMTNFDQGKFQKHVRCAVQQKETEHLEGVQPSALTAQKKSSRSTSEGRKSQSEGRKSPAKVGRSPSEGRKSQSEGRKSPAKVGRGPSDGFNRSSEKTKAHSKSLSPAPNPRGERNNKGTEGGINAQKRGKRSARRARTVENLMEELQRGGRGQMTPEDMKQGSLLALNSLNKEHSPTPKRQKQHQLVRAVPPLLLVTSPPPMGGGDEDNAKGEGEEGNSSDGGANNAEASAVLTLTAMEEKEEEGGKEEGGEGKEEQEAGEEEEEDYTGSSSYDEDEEYSDEEDYTDEEEWESDEGEWDEATVSRTLQLSGHESDFEFPFALGPSVVDKGNSNVLAPPPIFTASISYDGMSDSWGGRSYSDEGTNSTFYTEPSGDDVEVGFTLVQQCAMRGSDEEFTSTTSGSYTSGTYSSSFDDEEEEDEELSDEERASRQAGSSAAAAHRSRSASATSSSSSGESAESVQSEEEEGRKPEGTELNTMEEESETTVVMEECSPAVRKSASPMPIQMAMAQHQEEHEQMLEEHAMVEELEDGEQFELEELEESNAQDIDESKEIRREETYVRAQELRDGRAEEATRPLTGNSKPRTDFAKKAVVQPMHEEKLSVTEQKTLLAPDEQKIREEKERKRRMKEEEEERKKKMKEEEEMKKKMKEEEEMKKKMKEEEEMKKKMKEEEEKKKKMKEEEDMKKKMKEEEEKKKKMKEEEEKKKKMKEEEEKKKKMKEEEEKKKKMKEEEERKKKMKEEEERKKKMKEEEEQKKTAMEDKSAQRKSALNMREEDRIKADQAEKESAKQKARASGTVGERAKQYATATNTEQNSFAYKRSKALEPKPVEELKIRTFQPIQKPDPKAEESFEKQMAELREQMRQGSRKLESEFRDVSQGLKWASDEAKLKTKEEQHRSVMDKALSAFGKAEQEKRRQRELQESETERAKREREDREGKERERREKEKACSMTKPEPKRTVRRAAKEPTMPQSEDAKKSSEEGTTTKAPTKTKAYWERGARRKTEELMKFKDTPTVVGETKPETIKTDQGTANEQQKQPKGGEMGQKRGESGRKKRRRCARHGHRRRPFTRAPFDIDELLDWRGMDTFERMEAFFASRGAEKRPLTSPTDGGAPGAKRRGTEAQKVWISELRDIDKLYKASELRDIKLSAGA